MKQCFTAAQKRQDVRRAFLRFSHFVTETRQKKQNQVRLWREQMEQAAGTTGQDCDWGGHVRARNGKWERLVPQQPDLHIGSHTLVFLLVVDQTIIWKKTSTI